MIKAVVESVIPLVCNEGVVEKAFVMQTTNIYMRLERKVVANELPQSYSL